jgi:hypothetical protein
MMRSRWGQGSLICAGALQYSTVAGCGGERVYDHGMCHAIEPDDEWWVRSAVPIDLLGNMQKGGADKRFTPLTVVGNVLHVAIERVTIPIHEFIVCGVVVAL